MTAQDGPYVRVYFSILTDERFEGVYEDDAAFATWVRLLMIADGAYPAPAHVPAGVKPKALRTLVDKGLVELLPRHLYRVHGLDAERKKRAEAARFAADAKHHGIAEAERRQTERMRAAVRPQSEPHAIRSAETVPLQAEHLLATPRRAEPSISDAPRAKNGLTPVSEVTFPPFGTRTGRTA